MEDHLVERTALYVQVQAIFLSLNVLQSQCIVQVVRARSCMMDNLAKHTAFHNRQECVATG